MSNLISSIKGASDITFLTYNPNGGFGLPIAHTEIVGALSITSSSSTVDLNGGESPYPHESSVSTSEASFSAVVRVAMSEVVKAAFGSSVTTATLTSGSAAGLANSVGTSVFKSTTGVASVSVTNADNLKRGIYIIKAVSATTVDVYTTTSVDGGNYADRKINKINATPITITSGSAVNLLDGVGGNTFGLSLTGGSGSIAMTVGDEATFKVFAKGDNSYDMDIGKSGEVPKYVALAFSSGKTGGASMMIYAHKVLIPGFNFEFPEKEYTEFTIEGKLLYDANADKVMTILAQD